MRLWSNCYIGNPKRAMAPFQAHIALAFEGTRIVWSSFGSAPLWVEGRYIWHLQSPVWTRLQEGSSVWWCGQKGETVVIVGRGPRPALVMSQETWTGILPAGRGSAGAILPHAGSCQVKFSAAGPLHRQQAAR